MPDVLIVDDDPRVRALLELALLSHGFTVRQARDGFDALVAVAERPPDAIVTDLTMPRIDGFTMLEALAARGVTTGLPVVVHTAEDDPGHVERAADLGIAEYFLKPVDPELVIEAVGEHLVDDDLDGRDLATVTEIRPSASRARPGAAATAG